MFVDASALTAIIVHEQDWTDLTARLESQPRRMTSPIAVWETVLAVARNLSLTPERSSAVVVEYCNLAGIDIVAIPPEAAHLAVEAFDRYGKGRHAAALNMGDCFAWACARHYQAPLLYKGGDFDLIGIARA